MLHMSGALPCLTGTSPASTGHKTDAEQEQLSFLRVMTGVGRQAARDVLYRDLHRSPIIHRWVMLAARWWIKLARRQGEEQPGMAYQAWVSDLELMQDGCEKCWSYQLLSALEVLGVVQAHQWRREHGVSMMALQSLT